MNIYRKTFFILVFNAPPFFLKFDIVDHVLEPAKLFKIVDPVVAEARTEQLRKSRIAKYHPPARGYAVRFVAELFRGELIEVTKHVPFEQFSMEGGNAVYRMAADDR